MIVVSSQKISFPVRGVLYSLFLVLRVHTYGEKVLYLYENGIGAINLPYRESAVGLDHSRSVHPLTLLMVSEVVSNFRRKVSGKKPLSVLD